MKSNFYQHIFDRQQQVEAVPPNEEITGWAMRLICLLYPELSRCAFRSVAQIEKEFDLLKKDLIRILHGTNACDHCDTEAVAESFFEALPELYQVLNTDISAILNGDPAAKSEFEVIRAYPGFFAISFYRIANGLLRRNIPLLPRILTEYAHSKTGIDIHPGAEVGAHFHIDHGTGIVIGETTQIGKHVKLYQGVTLGALSVDKSMASVKRHPTIEDYVIIYAGATVLGGDTVIGHHSIIGGNVWLTKSIPPRSLAYHNAEITVVEGKFQKL